MGIDVAPHESQEKSHQSDISEQVIVHFTPIAEVQHIYLEALAETLIYWVFTSEPAYDSALLDRLIDEEVWIMTTFPNVHFDFHYIPFQMCPNPYDVVAIDADVVYQRTDS